MPSLDYSEHVQRTDHRLHDAGVCRGDYARRAGLRRALADSYCNQNAETVDNVARLIVAQHNEATQAGLEQHGTALLQMVRDAGGLFIPAPATADGRIDASVLHLARQLTDRFSALLQTLEESAEDGAIEPQEAERIEEEAARYQAKIAEVVAWAKDRSQEQQAGKPLPPALQRRASRARRT